MTNYICINGNKTELTEEQLRQLGIEVPKTSPFKRVNNNERFYRIGYDGYVYVEYGNKSLLQNDMFNVANYCTDKALMEQRALHEALNRLLWRYSMEHDGDKINWGNATAKFKIIFNPFNNNLSVDMNTQIYVIGVPYFYTEKIAQNAITEIIEPFMKEHPEFKW